MQKLTDEQIKNREFKEKLARECSKSLYVFLRNFWPVINKDKFIDNWHIKYLCDQLQRYGQQVTNQTKALPDLIINVPPGSSKSTIVSQMFPVWLWVHAPWAVVITTSYTRDLAVEHSLKAKDIYKSDLYQELFNAAYFKTRFGHRISLKKDNENDWINNFNGRRFATATKGRVTGSHAHIIIRDDPLNVEQAESKQIRMVTNRFNDATLPSRKKDKEKCPTITVMQRLHQEDPTGHDLAKKGKRIKHICIPAELSERVKPKGIRKFYIDGLMDPKRMNKSVLAEQKLDMGTYAYSGQYLQTPFPDEGGIIKKEWFVITDQSKIPNDITWDMWIDGAYTEETKNDPSGIVVMGKSPSTRKVYIKYATSEYMEMPALLKRVPEIAKEQGLDHESFIYIEPKASGESLRQLLIKETDYNVKKISGKLVQQGKHARCNTASPKVESGRVHLLIDNWNTDFIEQLAFFPNMVHDEYVDLLGYAINQYYIKGEVDLEVDVH